MGNIDNIYGLDNHYIYDDDLYPRGITTRRIPMILPVLLGPPSGRSTQEESLKNYSQSNCCRGSLYNNYNWLVATYLRLIKWDSAIFLLILPGKTNLEADTQQLC